MLPGRVVTYQAFRKITNFIDDWEEFCTNTARTTTTWLRTCYNSLLIDMCVKDRVKKMHLLLATEIIPCVQQKAQWAFRWCDSTTTSFAERMIVFTAIEGTLFSGSFCAIFWLKKCGLMPGLCFGN
jgi:hypothetical protein